MKKKKNQINVKKKIIFKRNCFEIHVIKRKKKNNNNKNKKFDFETF